MHRYATTTCALVLVVLCMLTLAFSTNLSGQRPKQKDNATSTIAPLTTTKDTNLVASKNTPLATRAVFVAPQISSGTNVAASSNGAVATASSVHVSGNYPVAAVNNGDRKAMNWGSGGGWNDNTHGDYSSDIVQVNFSSFNFVSQINVFTLRNNFQDNMTPPTLTETFNTCENGGNGITEFEVQFWTGSMWVTIPGGLVRDNNKVWRQFTFPEVWASAVRVQVHGAVRFTSGLNYSRIVEIEAFGRTEQNLAAAANGAMAFASSQFNANYPVSAVIDGDRTGFNWGRGGFGSGWNDATQNEYSIDWVRIDFAGGQARRINEIDVYTLRDGFSTNNTEPTIFETFSTVDNTGEGMTDYDVQYLSGGVWRTVPGGKVTANDKVRRQFRFSPITTNAIRVAVNKGANYTKFGNNWSRIVEIEAWENTTIPDDFVWVGDALPTGAIPVGAFEGWNWTCFDPLPLSGALAHKSDIVAGVHQHYFHGATQTLTVNAGDTMVAHVFLDPLNPPTQVMLQWNDGTWEHRAYWGQSQLPWGVEGTISRRSMGALPPTGQWVRLEVPASLVGLEGRTLNGMAFTLFNGRATWDHGGKFASSSPPPQPTISISDATVNEGQSGPGFAVFNVTLSSSSTQTINVNYSTANGTAIASSDYVPATGTLTFTPGQTSQPLAITIVGDTAVEPNENFFVNLSSPVNATLADSQGIGTILNDDTAPPSVSISINDATVFEGSCGGTPKTVFNVNLSAASAQNVSVNYVTSNGTATSPTDFIAANATFTIPAGQTTKTLEILARSDTSIEGDETFFVTFSNPVNATIGDGFAQAVIKDDDLTPPEATNPFQFGQWGPCEELEGVPVHINLLPDGRLLYWGRDKHADTWDTAGTSNTFTWHPVTKAKSGAIVNSTTNLFCSAHSFLPDGRLMVAGGHNRYEPTPDQELIGETDINLFNYQASPATAWSLSNRQMQQGRWYPSSVAIGNGEIAIFAGTYWTGALNSQMRPVIQRNFQPNIYSAQDTLFHSLDTRNVRNYPYLHLAPDGRVFGLAQRVAWFYDSILDQFSNAPATPIWDHNEGTSVLYNAEQGKVMVVGGRQESGGTVLTQVDFFDLPSQTWTAGAPMNFKRQYHNTTLLPDGKVLATGGTRCDGALPSKDCPEGPAHQPDIWNPATGAWTKLAENPTRISRIYHSVAVLLPDARVLVGGGGLPAAKGEMVVDTTNNTIVTCNIPSSDPVVCRHTGHKGVEIFSPPYLFQSNGLPAPRPTINTAPATVTHGETFNVAISSSSLVTSAALMRLPSVTHGLNFDQRRVVLTPQVVSTTNLTLTIPNQGAICPPGYYMLFVMNAAGVPSEAKFIKVTSPAAPATFPLFEVGARVTRNLDGRLQAFYKGADNAVYYTVQTSANSNSWSAHVSLGGVKTSNPVAIANADGRLEVFAKGTDNAIYHRWQLTPGSNSWSGWFLLASSAAGDPAVARNTNGRLQVVYRGGDNLLYTVAQTSPGVNSWTTPTNLFGTLISDPSVVLNADGRLEVFVVMTDNGIHHIWQTTAGSSTWSGWFGLGGFTNSTKLGVARNTDGLVQVFYREFGGSLFFTKQSPSSPGGWTPVHTNLGGGLNSDPTVGINADGRLEIFIRGTDNQLHHIWQTAPSGSAWSAWTPLGGGLTSGAAPAQNANGRVSAIVRGLDNALYYNVQSSAGSATWTGFFPIGGNASSF
jgi:hypothetical protein